MTKQEREMIAAISGSLGSAAALLQEAAKEPVIARSESSPVKGIPAEVFTPVQRPKVVECKEVPVVVETKEVKAKPPKAKPVKGGVRCEWSSGIPTNYLTLNESGRGSNVKELVFTPENTLIVEDYVCYKSGDGSVVKYGVSMVCKTWQKGRKTIVVFPVGNTLKGKRYVQEKNAAKLNGDIIEFKAEHLGMLQVMFRGATEANKLLASLAVEVA